MSENTEEQMNSGFNKWGYFLSAGWLEHKEQKDQSPKGTLAQSTISWFMEKRRKEGSKESKGLQL